MAIEAAVQSPEEEVSPTWTKVSPNSRHRGRDVPLGAPEAGHRLRNRWFHPNSFDALGDEASQDAEHDVQQPASRERRENEYTSSRMERGSKKRKLCWSSPAANA